MQYSVSLVVNSRTTGLVPRLGTNGYVKLNNFTETEISTTKLINLKKNSNRIGVAICIRHMLSL